ncbi:CoA ester lyase [Achromobacter sp. HZ28]|nr:CoA ester lyase [Achromobacter sp. HZ34]OWT81523.1 CoA ester lyase [Achromobacter sp. HZ28]
MFVPGLHADKQRAGLESKADVLVADLEEFTAPADRPAAWARIITFMAECRAQGAVGAVRINKLDQGGLDDLAGIMSGRPAAVLLPHVETPAQVAALDAACTAHERRLGLPLGSTEIVPTLESARGVVSAVAILTASPRVSACLLAAEDLSTDLGVVRGPDGIELQPVRARFLVDCIAAGCVPIDCPFSYRDDDALRADLAWARRIGLKAKCTVRESQVALIHVAMTPSHAEVAQARETVRHYEAPDVAGEAPVNGPDYGNARRLLARHEAFEAWNVREGAGRVA